MFVKTSYNGRLVEFLHVESFDCCTLIFACLLKAEGILKFIGSGVVQATRRLYGEAIDEHLPKQKNERAVDFAVELWLVVPCAAMKHDCIQFVVSLFPIKHSCGIISFLVAPNQNNYIAAVTVFYKFFFSHVPENTCPVCNRIPVYYRILLCIILTQIHLADGNSFVRIGNLLKNLFYAELGHWGC